MMVADLVTQFVEPSAYYVPGSPGQYTVMVLNQGTSSADNVAVNTTLAAQFSSRVWTADYSGGASGPVSGSGEVNTGAVVSLPIGGVATFSITGVFGASATGDAVSQATATVTGESITGNNTATNERDQAGQAIVVTDDASRVSSSTVRVVDSAAGAQQLAFAAYGSDVRGVQAVMADLDGNGRPEIVTAPLRGGAGEIRVFTVDGVELPQYRTQPFGAGWAGGLSIAVGDFDADGIKDIAAAKATGDGEVRIFRGQAGGDPIADEAYRTIRPFDAGALGGASIAAADLGTVSDGVVSNAAKQDGRDELVIANGPGVAPIVRIYDMSSAVPQVVDTIRPFATSFFGGLSVAAARVNADGIPDLLLSAGRRGNSAVEVYDGRIGSGANPRLDTFAAFAAIGRSAAAAYAAAIDTDGDGRADTIYSSQGAGGRGSLAELNRDGGIVGSLSAFAGPTRVAAPFAATDPAYVTTASGLRYREIEPGTGEFGAVGKLNTVDYTGTLLTGVEFDSSRRPGRSPFEFKANGRVTSVLITNGGSGYTSPPTVTFSAPASGGVRAEGVAVMGTGGSAQQVVGVTITKEGSGYGNATPATVTFSEPTSGTRATGSARVDRVIDGWTEAVALMRVGGRYQFVIPSNLGYGSAGTDSIPADSVLVFDIKLLSVAP